MLVLLFMCISIVILIFVSKDFVLCLISRFEKAFLHSKSTFIHYFSLRGQRSL